MGTAICFKCGSLKAGALIACQSCDAIPRRNSEYAVSLALSHHISPREKLTEYSQELRSGWKLSIPREALVEALEALKDPQLLAMLGAQLPASPPSAPSGTTAPTSSPTPRKTPPIALPVSRKPEPRVTATALHQSPFAVLAATTHDDSRRIIDLAEEKSLELDNDVCQKARSDLTNRRVRLSAEIAWLPGVSPEHAFEWLESVLDGPMAVREASDLPTLAHLNLLAAAFETLDTEHDAEDLAILIQEFAYLSDTLDPEEVQRDINEDRAVSGFTEVRSLDQIAAELAERRQYYRSVIRGALDRLPSVTLIQVMTDTVDAVTAGGEVHAPRLIDDLVDNYEVEAQEFLHKEAENIQKLIKAVRDVTNTGEAAVKPYVDKLGGVARNWDTVAQPIQLSTKARGIDHEASLALAYEIRSLALDLFNKHDMLHQSQQLTALLQELFAEVPDVSERVDEDADALADIFQERKQAEEHRDEWVREITYSAEIGMFFKDNLSISTDGVSWNQKTFALDSITRVRWGGIRHSVNGVSTGTSYTVAFGDTRSEVVVELKSEDIYSTFIGKLWRAVCVRLLVEMLGTLKAGRELRFGDALVHDDGITLVKHKFLGANENVRCPWGQVQLWSADGSLCVSAKDDKKTSVSISYIDTANTHILERAIRMMFEKAGMRRLSELLE